MFGIPVLDISDVEGLRPSPQGSLCFSSNVATKYRLRVRWDCARRQSRVTIVAMDPELFPLFLKLQARRCLVVGAGAVAENKIEGLLRSGADVTVIAPRATPRVQQWAGASELSWQQREFQSADLEHAFLAIAATSSPAVNHLVAAEARRRNVLCNVVDDPEYCDFFYPAVVRRGALQVAISTGGTSPALARRLRQQLELQFGPEYGPWLELVDASRREILASVPDAEERRARLEALVSEDSFREFLQRK